MEKSYINREYVTIRVFFIVAIVLLSNLAWSLIFFSNGASFSDILNQKGFINKLVLGIIETTTLIELSFFIVWKALTLRDRHSIRLYVVAILISAVASAFFSLAFCQFKKDSIDQFMTNFAIDLIISFLATVVFTMIIHKNMMNDLIQEKESILEEKARLAEANAIAQADSINMRIDNHLFFNSLSVLASLIQDDPQKAEEFLLEMTDMHRNIIRMSSSKSIAISEEFRLLETYMNMSRYRFGDGCIEFVITPQTGEHLSSHIIPLSLLHLVENAIKHNSYSQESPLTIVIDIETKGNVADYITVTNNRQEKVSKPVSTKQGLENIRRKYILVSGQEPVIEDNNEYFKVKLPIIEQWKY